MRKLIKIMSLMLCLIMTMSIFSGFSRTEKKNVPSWSLDKSPVTLNWFIDQNWFSANWDSEKTLVYKTITEKTGVKVNFIVPPGDASEKLNTMIASGETLPDMMTLSIGMPQVKLLERNKMVYPLMELVDKYAPTFSGASK